MCKETLRHRVFLIYYCILTKQVKMLDFQLRSTSKIELIFLVFGACFSSNGKSYFAIVRTLKHFSFSVDYMQRNISSNGGKLEPEYMKTITHVGTRYNLKYSLV